MAETEEVKPMQQVDYGDSNIITLEGLEHVRRQCSRAWYRRYLLFRVVTMR